MKYNFIELGSGRFSEHINYANDQTKGIVVEPVQDFLDTLPEKQGVQKLLKVVASTAAPTIANVYSIPLEVMTEYNLDPFLKTIHGLGEVHPGHVSWQVDYLAEKKEVPTITLSNLFQENNVEGVLVLKVAALANNTEILDSFENWLKTQPTSVLPKKIQLTNETEQKQQLVDTVLGKYSQLGYQVHSQTPEYITLVYRP